jgi:hypothetical protein
MMTLVTLLKRAILRCNNKPPPFQEDCFHYIL